MRDGTENGYVADYYEEIVEPLLSGHPWDTSKWPLKPGLMEVGCSCQINGGFINHVINYLNL